MDTHDLNAQRPALYVVDRRRGRWSVTYDEAGIGEFRTAEAASRFACDLARIQADSGVAATVFVNADVREEHRFTSAAALGRPVERALD